MSAAIGVLFLCGVFALAILGAVIVISIFGG
jgi:hypothetical protein